MSAQASDAPVAAEGGIAGFFKFGERGTNLRTETRAGLTTFMVMAYIIFLNPSILMAGFGDADPNFTATALAAGTALVAGIMTIAMGVAGNYPLALAAGLGINGIVAFSLTGQGLSPAGAMGVIVWEGVVVTVLVVVGFREAIMNAVPLALKRAIGVGIGLFILFIGFANGGFVVANPPATPVTFHLPTEAADFVFWIGLRADRRPVVAPHQGRARHQHPGHHGHRADRRRHQGAGHLRADALVHHPRPVRHDPGLLGAADPDRDHRDLHDHAHRLLRHDGDRHRRRQPKPAWPGRTGRCPAWAASCSSTRWRPWPVAPPASAPTPPTSSARPAWPKAAGRASRPSSPVSCSCSRSSCHRSRASCPRVATAPALVLVGYLMFTQIKDINVTDVEDGIPALLTMILMPLTYDITVGHRRGLRHAGWSSRSTGARSA